MNSKVIKHSGSLCLEADCKWSRSCANHETAGDHRYESGFSPILRWNKEKTEITCHSLFSPPEENYHETPKDHFKSGFIHASEHDLSTNLEPFRCCDGGWDFTVTQDKENRRYFLECNECKKVREILFTEDIRTREERRKAHKRMLDFLMEGEPPITEEEMEAIRKEWEH